MDFPVFMYGCESWTVKKAESRIDAFELWCWRRLLKVPWTARRANQKPLVTFNSPRGSLSRLSYLLSGRKAMTNLESIFKAEILLC